jgi:hypothetical protein
MNLFDLRHFNPRSVRVRQTVVERCRTVMSELLEMAGILEVSYPTQVSYSAEELNAQIGMFMATGETDETLGLHLRELHRLFSELEDERMMDQFVLHLSHVAEVAEVLHEGQSREAWEYMVRNGATRCTACRHQERCRYMAHCRFCHHPRDERRASRVSPPQVGGYRPAIPSPHYSPYVRDDSPPPPMNPQLGPSSTTYSPSSPTYSHSFPSNPPPPPMSPGYSPSSPNLATAWTLAHPNSPNYSVSGPPPSSSRFTVFGSEVPRAAESAPLCVVCFETRATTAISCGHQGFCVDCVKKFENCPLCRESVKFAINLWPLTVTREEQDRVNE